jgi:tRNA threonylcarbamoyl adenosine modification protein (Sua5/YciO/YrdC/YwlC family)
MRVITKQDYTDQKPLILSQIKAGAIVIHPTDTIYGIGCNALINNSVKRIRDLKDRPEQPFSLIAPSINWIRANCVVTDEAEEWLKKLPGPYTLVLPLKDEGFFSSEISYGKKTLGIRYPNHWIKDLVEDLGYPLVTTSVNKKGHQFMTCVENLDPDIEKGVDIVIHDGELVGSPSQIIRFDKDETEIIKR